MAILASFPSMVAKKCPLRECDQNTFQSPEGGGQTIIIVMTLYSVLDNSPIFTDFFLAGGGKLIQIAPTATPTLLRSAQ